MQSETASCFGIVKGFMSFIAGTSIARHFYLFSASLRTNYEENEENLMDLRFAEWFAEGLLFGRFKAYMFYLRQQTAGEATRRMGWAILPGKQHGREKYAVIKVVRLSCQSTRTSGAFAARFRVHMFSPHSIS